MHPTKGDPAEAAAASEAATLSPAGYGYEKNLRTALPQVIAVSVKNLLLLAYGMTLGFPTILIPAVSSITEQETLRLNPSEVSWIGSLNLIVVPLGCAVSGAVTTPLGRRRSMQLVNVPFFAAWILLHYASTSTHLYVALCLTGLAGGLLEAPVLTYVAEVTQPHLRGSLTATSSMCIIIGVFTQFLFGLIFYWRTVALVNIIFTVLAIVALCFVPESPHWLVSRNRLDEARKSLQWLRGWTTAALVEDELIDIRRLFNKKEVLGTGSAGNGGGDNDRETMLESLAQYTKRSFLLPFFLVSYAFFVGHFSGMTSLQTYAVKIFQRLHSPLDKYYATLVLGVMQISGSLVCVALVHSTGKRPLTLLSLCGVAICCVVVATYDYSVTGTSSDGLANSSRLNGTEFQLNSEEGNQYSWVPMASLMLLAGLSHTGIRLLPWILIGEVFSAKTRSGASGLSSAMGYIFAFLSNKFFINMLDTMSISGTYGFYAFISVTGAVVLYFILPETEGKKLMDIENHFAGIKRLTNKVYRSKKAANQLKNNNITEKAHVNPAFDVEISRL